MDNIPEIADRCIRIQQRGIPFIVHHKINLIIDPPYNDPCQQDQCKTAPLYDLFLFFPHVFPAPFMAKSGCFSLSSRT